MRHGFAAIGLALMAPLSAVSAQDVSDCAVTAEALPEGLGGWTARAPIDAAADKAGLKRATLAIGQGVDAALRPTRDIRYSVRPEKPGGSVSYGGMFRFTISEAGTYRIALGSGAWIDVLKGKAAVVSVAHGHGPACSGIRKMVDFPLTPGRYTLQIAANGEPTIAVLLARLP